jgi:dephospho-CoA kinase
MTAQKFAGILKSQMADRQKRALADIIIETGRGRRHTWAAVRRLVRSLPGG